MHEQDIHINYSYNNYCTIFFIIFHDVNFHALFVKNQHFYQQQFQYSRDIEEREKYECKIYHGALLQTALPSISPRPVCYTAVLPSVVRFC